MIRLAARLGGIAPFRVMQILARARAIEARGGDIVHMEIGEPDFISPPAVIAAGRAALAAGRTHYTPAAGLAELREAIATYYRERFSVDVASRNVLVTPGASGALQLLLGVLVDPGERVAVTDPGYPCNRHMVAMYGGEPVPIAVDVVNGFGIARRDLEAAMQGGLRALMLASPANPTGNLIANAQLAELADCLATQDGVLICDEIYQGLQYGSEPETALQTGRPNLVVINSFSKFFGMTGWRVGWIVAPEGLIEPMERLAQNLFLAAPTVGQYAALAAFDSATMMVLEQRRAEFEARRDFLFDAVAEMGFGVGRRPGGAFYLYADVSDFTDDSQAFCTRLLEEVGVAVTPGSDFGNHLAARHVRFAFTTGIDRLEQGAERLHRFLRAGG
ncbi:MAG: aminotransferase class I/II-fold pyridoxal phosphate-dependent enzyme [Gammaproteobacteria bacterium]|nr:aminotransferase class I/II-fold pyridoxal phosphate-dependent enzyme [Gammaproteobacteria bacterium]